MSVKARQDARAKSTPSRAIDGAAPAHARAAFAWWAAGAALAAGILVYANTLGHGFVWDDLILLDQKVRFYRGPLDVWREPTDLPGFRVYRPLTFGSYWLDQLLWSRNPLGFHLSSVALHALDCGLVYALACALGCAASAALWAALLFAVHPVHSEAVAWVACRADLLATAFTILAVLACLRDAPARSPATRWASRVGVAAASFAAAASKETGVVVPLLLLALPPRASGGAAPDARRSRWPAVALSAGGVLAYLALRPGDRSPALGLAAFDLAGIAQLAGAFGFYVERALLPLGVTAYVPQAPAGAAVMLAAAAGVAAAAWLVLARPADGGLRRFATLWSLLTLAPAVLVAVAGMLVTKVSERYLYLPSVGLALLVAGELTRRPRLLASRAAAAAAATMLVGLGVATAGRNLAWRDEIALWTAVTRHQTRFALPYMNLGLALAEAGRLTEAEAAYRTALAGEASESGERDVYINLGHLELKQGKPAEATEFFERANAIGPHASAYYGLGAAARARARELLRDGDAAAAAQEFARAQAALTAALAINPRHYQSHFVLASVLYQSGDLAGAIEHFRRVVELAADTPTGADAAAALAELTRAPAGREEAGS